MSEPTKSRVEFAAEALDNAKRYLMDALKGKDADDVVDGIDAVYDAWRTWLTLMDAEASRPFAKPED